MGVLPNNMFGGLTGQGLPIQRLLAVPGRKT